MKSKSQETLAFIAGAVFLFGGLSSACMKIPSIDYVPDAFDKEDETTFPWKDMKKRNEKNFINECSCGATNSRNTSIPWNALIRVKRKAKTSNCLGSLINSKFVLTSYSCLMTVDFAGINPWLPDTRLSPQNLTVEFNTKAKYEVAEIIYNIEYPNTMRANNLLAKSNVALLRLELGLNLKLDNKPKPVCLNPPIDPGGVEDGILIGWGSEEDGIKSSGNISEINVTMMINSLKECRKNSPIKILDGHVCVPPRSSSHHIELIGHGTGAPLIIKSISNQDLQVGVGSFSDSKDLQEHQATHLYFTTIKSIIPFIHFYSEKYGAKWCKEPLEDEFNMKRSHEHERYVNERPWEVEFISSDKRDESLGCTCGIRLENQGRVVGGDAALPLEFKWQILLRIKKHVGKNVQTSICGGSLINSNFIMTASHCILDNEKIYHDDFPAVVKPEDIAAYYNIQKKNDDPNQKPLGIRFILYPQEYVTAQTKGYYHWDVALLELTEPFVSFDDEKVIPICLPKSNAPLEVIGKDAIVSGWGKTDPENPNSLAEVLMKIQIPIQPLDFCTKITDSAGITVTDVNLCAGTLNRYKDSAEGDSGGPLIIRTEKDNQYVQVGLVSWAMDAKDSASETAAFYTDIQKVLSFVDYFSYKVGAKWCST